MTHPMFASFSLHNVKIVEASAMTDLPSVPFLIKLESNQSFDHGFGEVCFHLENIALAEALVAAINAVLKTHAIEAAQPQQEDL